MYRKDYILRMIEMLGELIAGILGLIKNGDLNQASQALENAYIDYLKQDASFFSKISNDKLTATLLDEHNYTNDHLEILSELFYAQAELSHAQGFNNDSVVYYQKAIILLDFVDKNSECYSDARVSKIASIQSKIECLS